MKIIALILFIFVGLFNFNISFAEGNSDSTNNQEEVKKLKLNSFKEIGKNQIKLEFDKKINKNSDIDISVRNTKDNKENFVVDMDIKDNVVILKLENDLKSNNEYEIIIFLIEAEDGSTITSALDGAVKFTVGDLSVYDKEQESTTSSGAENTNNQNVGVQNIEEQNTELNSAGIEKTNTGKINKTTSSGTIKEQNPNLAGRELRQDELEQQVVEVAAKKDKLVKTGPEHILLLILSFVLAGLIGYAIDKRKKGEI